MKNKIIVSSIILSIIFIMIISFSIGKVFEKESQQLKFSKMQEELDLLKFQVEIFYLPLQEEVYSIDGAVIEVGDKFLVIEAIIQINQLPLPERGQIEMQNIKVNIAEGTEIFQLEMIVSEVSEEMPSDPFEKVLLRFEDIKIGDFIMVISEENIKGEKEIMAKEIQIIKDIIPFSY